jgi:SpoVK/Ycf46/Vps4 family AAA+-type ATPase
MIEITDKYIKDGQLDKDALLTVTEPKIRLSSLTFSPKQNKVFERLILEFRQQSKLRQYGLKNRRKLLLYGPPGSGKTVSASALASELNMPLFTVRLDGLITKYMGETASNLRQVFEFMRSDRGLYFFDEFDVIGSKRHSSNDVGEIRRVLNSFLTFMEEDNSDSLIVAATNHIDLLDFALFRRFDDVIRYELPSSNQVRQIVENRLYKFTLKEIDWDALEKEAAGLSHAEITRSCDDAAKTSVLERDGTINTNDLVRALKAWYRSF